MDREQLPALCLLDLSLELCRLRSSPTNTLEEVVFRLPLSSGFSAQCEFAMPLFHV
jgi:hypothetical protein